MQVAQLTAVNFRGGTEHQVAGLLRFREGDDVPDGILLHQQHDEPVQAEGNAAVADFLHVDAARNLIYDARATARRTPIALVGVRDAIVVLTDDATLVADKGQAQKIKDLVRKLGTLPNYRHLI